MDVWINISSNGSNCNSRTDRQTDRQVFVIIVGVVKIVAWSSNTSSSIGGISSRTSSGSISSSGSSSNRSCISNSTSLSSPGSTSQQRHNSGSSSLPQDVSVFKSLKIYMFNLMVVQDGFYSHLPKVHVTD